MRADPYYKKNLEQRIIKNADQTEFSAILAESVLVDAGFYDDKVSGALDDFKPEEDMSVTENWHALDIEYESASGAIYEEIERRSNLLGDAYPFKINGNQISYVESKSYFYEFCLAICSADNITTGTNKYFPRVFERISAVLIKSYLGHDSDCVHVGSPRDSDVGKKFVDAMKKVHELTNELRWNSIEDFGTEPQTTGDEGVDFIAWKNLPDKRKGKLFVMGQCACGDDWNTKFNDLSLGKLNKWFQPLCYVYPPIRAFTIPFHLSNINLANAQRDAGMVFDRASLSILAESYFDSEEIKNWKDKIKKLAMSVIKYP
jgi:hypothetical protein